MRRILSFFTITLFFFIFSLPTLASIPKKGVWARWDKSNENSTKHISHERWQEFLNHVVKPNAEGINVVDYPNITREDKTTLNEYILGLAFTRITNYNQKEQKAFWINLYNALVVKTVLDHYPVGSIQDIHISPGALTAGPWGANLLKVDRTYVSLDDIKHHILRPIWQDPRLHYVLNQAAMGSPNLPKRAFTANNTEKLLNTAAKQFISSPRGVQIVDGRLIISKIFGWYRDDFGRSDTSIIKHIRHYANKDLQKQLAKIRLIAATRFNWQLNQATSY